MTDIHLTELERQLRYSFKNRRWLEQALVHSSYAYEFPLQGPSNERLEFFGDAVLSLFISDFLMEYYPQAGEGLLSRWRASLVNARHLAGIARSLDLGGHLRLGRGEEQQSGRRKPSVLADALEAVLAAVYLDGGFAAARGVVKLLFQASLTRLEDKASMQDFKTLLQEYAQKNLKVTPTYRVVTATGPAHARTFEVEVWLADQPWGRGQGKSKKQAAQEAARLALAVLEKD
ncbi:ribonuclease III [Desulfobacca acetoxidans]|uniref:Ribonuclease 3 n=1 Tax=Desulfobacca acetoxidans (strain ATCC 700848 / DSM 11109 / ASRB2) TaxID=880072 RepID=F2NHD6_DESAR|nr:ribonuclease III [Desulfobacca acetoxidans]AEB09052.1 Ribonuclease 3 [Desulfobacca acetoxidans DSM 11109]